MIKFLLKTIIYFVFLLAIFIPASKYTLRYKHKFVGNYDSSIKENSHAEVLYLASSVEAHIDKEEDTNKMGISQMIDSLNSLDVEAISRGANNSRLFYLFYKDFIKRNKNKNLKFLVIEINLRSFSPEWDRNKFYNFKDIQYYFNWKSIFEFENKSYPDYNKVEIDDITYKIKAYTQLNNEKLLKNDIAIKYLYNLDESNETLQALKNLVEMENDKIPILFYFTPIDIEICNATFNNFEKKHERTLSYIKRIIKNNHFIDITYALNSSYFDYPIYGKDSQGNLKGSINEHLNEKGRFFVADTISKYLSRLAF